MNALRLSIVAIALCADLGPACAQEADGAYPPPPKAPSIVYPPPDPVQFPMAAPPPAPRHGDDIDPDDLYPRQNPGLFVAGVLTTALGGATAAAGLLMSTMHSCLDSDPPICEPLVPRVVSIPVVIHGLVAVAFGAPMVVIGNKRTPRRTASAPEVLVGPAGGGMRWSF